MSSPTTDASTPGIARLATTTGAVTIAAEATYAAFAAVGQPWGTINDITFAAMGVSAGALAWRLRRSAGTPASAAAVAGAGVAVAGSSLVVSGATGWLLAGFVSAVGFGLIGPSVAVSSRRLAADRVVPSRLGRLGLLAGISMTIGLTAAVPVAMRVDDAATAPAWSWLTMSGWVGAAILYPIWTIWLGRVMSRRPDPAAGVAAAV